MRKIAVVGDIDSIYGFLALGLEPFSVLSKEEALEKIKKLTLGDYAVIYVTEGICEMLEDELKDYYSQTLPAIIPIPGVGKRSSFGINNVKKFVEQAVGSDILFGDG